MELDWGAEIRNLHHHHHQGAWCRTGSPARPSVGLIFLTRAFCPTCEWHGKPAMRGEKEPPQTTPDPRQGCLITVGPDFFTYQRWISLESWPTKCCLISHYSCHELPTILTTMVTWGYEMTPTKWSRLLKKQHSTYQWKHWLLEDVSATKACGASSLCCFWRAVTTTEEHELLKLHRSLWPRWGLDYQ